MSFLSLLLSSWHNSNEIKMNNDTASVVLFCIIRRTKTDEKGTEYLLMPKIGYEPSFPATKYRKNEDLYTALSRIMTGDLNLDENSFFPETELADAEKPERKQSITPDLKKTIIYILSKYL